MYSVIRSCSLFTYLPTPSSYISLESVAVFYTHTHKHTRIYYSVIIFKILNMNFVFIILNIHLVYCIFIREIVCIIF